MEDGIGAFKAFCTRVAHNARGLAARYDELRQLTCSDNNFNFRSSSSSGGGGTVRCEQNDENASPVGDDHALPPKPESPSMSKNPIEYVQSLRRKDTEDHVSLTETGCDKKMSPSGSKHVSLHDRLARYLESKGLDERDVPKVLAWFVVAKYSTWALFCVIGIRFQPLTYAFRRARSRGRERFQKEVDRVVDMETNYAKRVRAAEKSRLAVKDRFHKARSFGFSRMKEKKEKWKTERPGWYRWFGDKYNYHSKHMADRLAQSKYWVGFARLLHQNPRKLAIGTTEGSILYKLTIVFTAPLELWLIAKAYQKHEHRSDDETSIDLAKMRGFAHIKTEKLGDEQKSDKVKDQSWLSSA